MEDRFKFRVFISDKKNSKNSLTGMFKVHSLHTGTNKAIITSLYGNCSIKLENNILMQCTGLKDKNGKLIYEGDIISFNCTYINKITNYKFAIVFFNGCFGVFTETNFEPLTQFLDYHYENEKTIYDDCYAEVIGNIYQNPELLED